jgi:electron transfer flavoprotein alpha/beta subunit
LAQLALPQANNKNIVARDHQRMQTLKGAKCMEPSQPSVISVDPKSLKPKNITRAHHIMYNSRKPTASVPAADQKPVGAVSKLVGVLGKKGADTTSPPLPLKVPAVQTKVDASKLGRKSSSPSCSTSKQVASDQKPKNVDLSALSRPTIAKFGSINLGDLGRKSSGGNNKQNAKVNFFWLHFKFIL